MKKISILNRFEKTHVYEMICRVLTHKWNNMKTEINIEEIKNQAVHSELLKAMCLINQSRNITIGYGWKRTERCWTMGLHGWNS